MSNKLVADENTRILLDRRAELKEQINKLSAEYTAIGDILTRLYHLENPTGIEIDMQMEKLQKIKEHENNVSGNEER